MRAGEAAIGESVPSAGASPTEMAGMRLSLPLYLGGLVVTLCGVQAVCATMGDTDITIAATALSLLGFAFSLACRALKVQPRVIEIACLVLIGAVVCEWALQGQVFGQNISWYITGADKTEDRLAAGLMWSAVFWSWTVVSGDVVLFSCVLTAAMIGLTGSVNVNNSTVFFFCLFVLAMIFLLIYQNYLQNWAGASARERARVGTEGRVLQSQIGLSAVSAALVLSAGLALVVPLRAMLSSLSLGQAIRQLVGERGYTVASSGLAGQRFSDDAGLDIGRGTLWPTSPDVVMHALSSDNQPHYWRGRTYDLYTGVGWQSTHRNEFPLDYQETTDTRYTYGLPTTWVPGEGQAFGISALRTKITTTIDIKGDTSQFYYADEPRSLVLDRDDGASPQFARDGCLNLDGRTVRGAYSVVSAAPPDPADPAAQVRLRRDGANYPAPIQSLYLSLPTEAVTGQADTAYFKEAVREALRGLPARRRSPLDQALALQAWITARCTYALTVDALPPDQDHVHAFLSDTRRGYCDLFASSMVVLCRTAGIPARLATGFAPGTPVDSGGYDIRAMDKHAWAEVYFPGDGWLIFDPTVGSHTDGSIPGGASAHQSLWQRARLWASANGPLPIILAAVLALCLGYVGKTEIYDRRPRRRAARAPVAPAVRARTDLGRQYALMTHSLAKLGLPRRASETPTEYESRIVPLLAKREAALGVPLAADSVHALTAQFVAARYGGAAGGDSALAARLARQVSQSTARARRVQWRRRLRGGPPLD